MASKFPPFTERWRDRHGRLRVYFRKGHGPRIPLPDDPGSPEFAKAYSDALSGAYQAPPKPKPKHVEAGTLAAVIRSYMASTDYLDLRETTKRGYRNRLRILEDEHGHRTLSGMTRQGIEAKILGPYADRPGQRLAILKNLRVLIRYAIGRGWLKVDPSVGIKRPKNNEIPDWSEADIAQFEARWPLGTRERTAFALHLYTGQRRSDVHRMVWADLEGDAIRVTQQKTGAKLAIALHPALKDALDAAPRVHMAILTTGQGAAFTVAGFSNFMRDAIREAGLPLRCQPHGLRKAAGRRLAEAGCTAHEIMAVLGHKSLAEAERYTRTANQAALARAAVGKLSGQTENKSPKPSLKRVGNRAKKHGASGC